MLFKVRVVYFKFMATRFNLCFSTRGFCRPGGMSNITKFYVKKSTGSYCSPSPLAAVVPYDFFLS